MAKPSFSQDAIGRAALMTPAAINPSTGSQSANHANSTSPATAVLSNTAASYATLGGRFQFAAVVGLGTDYALFAFQVPAGFRLFITDISISVVGTGIALVSAAIFDWSLGIKSTAESLATAGLIRIPLGMQGLLALAGIGQGAAPDLLRRFDPELVVEHEEYVHVILQIPIGAATPTLVFRGDVMIHGYFESVLG